MAVTSQDPKYEIISKHQILGFFPGATYTFDQSDSTNLGRPLKIATYSRDSGDNLTVTDYSGVLGTPEVRVIYTDNCIFNYA